jgi:hypothetical protein
MVSEGVVQPDMTVEEALALARRLVREQGLDKGKDPEQAQEVLNEVAVQFIVAARKLLVPVHAMAELQKRGIEIEFGKES